jgi:D-lactate dehydrogenase
VKLAEGFEGISIFTTDNASDNTGKIIFMWCQIYCLTPVGSDNVDKKKARALGIKEPTFLHSHSVAEHAAALLLALNRKII